MKMYSREDLMNMNNFGDVEADEDEDDDDDFPTKLVKHISPNRWLCLFLLLNIYSLSFCFGFRAKF